MKRRRDDDSAGTGPNKRPKLAGDETQQQLFDGVIAYLVPHTVGKVQLAAFVRNLIARGMECMNHSLRTELEIDRDCWFEWCTKSLLQ